MGRPTSPNPPCQLFQCRETGVPEENLHDIRQSIDIFFSHEDWFRVTLGDALLGIEPATSKVKGEKFDDLATIYHVVLGLAIYNFQRL